MLELRLLGQFEVRYDGNPIEIPTRGAQALLAYLALNQGVSHRRERLAGMLWPDSSDDNARAYLRHALWRVRRSLDETEPASSAYLSVDDIEIGFKPQAPHWLDIEEMSLDSAETQPDADVLQTQLSHYQGELLPGFYDEWAILAREHLNAHFERKMKRLIDLLVAAAEWDQVFSHAERWIAFGRVPEAAYQALMIAHAGLGDAAAVRATYQRLGQALERELGLQPSADVEATYHSLSQGLQLSAAAIPAGAAQQAVQELPPAPGEPPYLGLSYFDVQDAARFFGRGPLTAKLVAKLVDHPFLGVVVGASGSGKSSLVRAGLVPALQAGEPLDGGVEPPAGCSDWSFHVLTPGSQPLDSLAASLTRSARTVVEAASLMDDMAKDPRSLRLYLRRQVAEANDQRAFILVDQFEELFTQCQNEAARLAFIDNLMAAAEPDGGATVVIVLRADFYGHCADYPALRQALADHQAYIGGMNARELRQAIQGPAEAGKWELQPGLVELMLRDVRGEPGSLPLLSHALLETWRRRSGRTLTLTGYAQAGGVRRAIARTAESVYNQLLDRDQQAIAKAIFIRLTGVGQAMADTRRRARFSELANGNHSQRQISDVLTLLGDARLITLHKNSVELAHEALIREWPRLRRWLDEDRESLELHRHLTETALEWERLDRDPGELYRGIRLTVALEQQAADKWALNSLEREFLEQSQAQAAAERTARQRQSRRLRTLAAGLASALALALVAAGFALRQADRAGAQARLANQRAIIAAAINNLPVDPELSMLLALHAIGDPQMSEPSILQEAETVLRDGLQASRAVSTFPGSRVVVFQPSGEWLVTAADNRTLSLVDPLTGEALKDFQPHAGEWVTAAAISPDGARFVTGSFAGELKLWDSASWQQVWSVNAHDFAVQSLAISPDGRLIASGGSERMVKVWEAGSGDQLVEFEAHRSRVTGLAFSADSSRLISAGADQHASIWDLESGERLATLEGHTAALTAVAASPDGDWLATAATDDSIRVWQADSGTAVRTIEGAHAGGVSDLAFLADGDPLVSVGVDGYARIWDRTSGSLLQSIFLYDGEAASLAITGDGSLMASAPVEGNVRVWRLRDFVSGAWAQLPGHTGPVRTLEFNPSGDRLASGGEDGRVLVWNPETASLELEIHPEPGAVSDVAFNPVNGTLATAGRHPLIEFWNPGTGQRQTVIQNDSTEYVDLAFSVDGTRLNALGIPFAFIFNLETNQPEQRFANAGNTDGAYSPDGSLYAWTDRSGQIGTVRLISQTEFEVLPHLADLGVDVYGAEFSPDSRRLVTAAEDGIVRIWDTDPALTAFEYSEADREHLRLVGHRGPVRDAVFTPDGQRIATLGQDGTVRLWDAQLGDELYGLREFGSDLDVSPDGRYLAVATEGGTISLYLLRFADLVDQVQSRLTRDLSDAECDRYLGTSPCPELPIILPTP